MYTVRDNNKIYGVPSAISSQFPTRTLLRQRYIGFAVPSFFFCFATGIQNVRKRRRPYRKSEAFDSVVRRRRL